MAAAFERDISEAVVRFFDTILRWKRTPRDRRGDRDFLAP
jgi:hypothetical protein